MMGLFGQSMSTDRFLSLSTKPTYGRHPWMSAFSGIVLQNLKRDTAGL
jgi:hypothetical protein